MKIVEQTAPFFSIILPVFNGERYICKSIESVLAQTDGDWELIVIDDCSKDKTPSILEYYASKYSQIKVFRNEVNLHIARSLNRGIYEASGIWMVRLDSDDILSKEYLAQLRNTIEKKQNNLECFYSCWVEIINAKGKKVLDVQLPEASVIKKMIKFENFLYHSGTSFSKRAWQLVGGYPLSKTLAEDNAMWQKFFQKGMELIMIPERIVQYRIHQANITSVNDAKLFKNSSPKELEMKIMRQYAEWRISLFLKQCKPSRARREMHRLFLRQKGSFKNSQYYLLTFLPLAVTRLFMWEIRPRLRLLSKVLTKPRIRV